MWNIRVYTNRSVNVVFQYVLKRNAPDSGHNSNKMSPQSSHIYILSNRRRRRAMNKLIGGTMKRGYKYAAAAAAGKEASL